MFSACSWDLSQRHFSNLNPSQIKIHYYIIAFSWGVCYTYWELMNAATFRSRRITLLRTKKNKWKTWWCNLQTRHRWEGRENRRGLNPYHYSSKAFKIQSTLSKTRTDTHQMQNNCVHEITLQTLSQVSCTFRKSWRMTMLCLQEGIQFSHATLRDRKDKITTSIQEGFLWGTCGWDWRIAVIKIILEIEIKAPLPSWVPRQKLATISLPSHKMQTETGVFSVHVCLWHSNASSQVKVSKISSVPCASAK